MGRFQYIEGYGARAEERERGIVVKADGRR
jgi:hypothetical protein